MVEDENGVCSLAGGGQPGPVIERPCFGARCRSVELVHRATRHGAIFCWMISVLSGCDLLRITEPPLDPPEITGVIMRVDLDPPRGQGLRQLLIDEDPAPGTPETCRSAYFAVSSAAILVRQPDGSWRRGRKEDLRVGAVASGWYKKGSLALDSCPRQGEASVIAILESGQ